MESRSKHGWEARSSKRGIKLLNLLNRKEGFEKLDQDASDDENTSGKLLKNKSAQSLLSEELA